MRWTAPAAGPAAASPTRGAGDTAMRRTPVPNAPPLKAALARELRRSDLARHLQRLHSVLLVSTDQSNAQVAAWFGLSPRTVER